MHYCNSTGTSGSQRSPQLSSTRAGGCSDDLTGEAHQVGNLVTSWASHLVFVITGFVLPRVIDRKLGQASLGIWDFSWTLVNYFGIAQAGVGSAVNRYVSFHRALGLTKELNSSVSSVFAIQLLAAALVVVLSGVFALAAPHILGAQIDKTDVNPVPVVLFLGMSLAVQIAFSTYDAVITGCHRWDIHNAINAAFHAVVTVAMVLTLNFRPDLSTLAILTFSGAVIACLYRRRTAYRLCPELRISIVSATRAGMWDALHYGGKSLLNLISRLLLYQTSSIVVACYLGPESLAVYARSNALIRHVQTIVNKCGFIFGPRASSLQAVGRDSDLRLLVSEATRCGAFISLPLLLFLGIMGGSILQVWMGEAYARGEVIALLAFGHLLPTIQQPTLNILCGLNLHGRPGVAALLGSIAASLLGILALGPFQAGLAGAAFAVGLPLTVSVGIYVPVRVCKHLGMNSVFSLWDGVRAPVLCAVPFALCLIATRLVFPAEPGRALSIGGLLGGTVYFCLYWFAAVPVALRIQVASWGKRLCLKRAPR